MASDWPVAIAADGRELWRFPWKSDFDINAAQPVVVDDDRSVITSASGTALVKIEQVEAKMGSAEEVWRSRTLKGGYASPIATKDTSTASTKASWSASTWPTAS